LTRRADEAIFLVVADGLRAFDADDSLALRAGATAMRIEGATFWLRRVTLLVVIVLVAAGCDWTMFGYGPGNTRYNPSEKTIAPGNVASLTTAWSASVDESTSAAVANGMVYVGSDDEHVYAFDAAGSAGCSGTPKTCAPLWSASVFGSVKGSPAVVNGVVYVATNLGDLYAFDAAGSTFCSGTPKTCGPLWTAAGLGEIVGSPTVANGVVYVGSGDGHLYAFDAAGATNCVRTAMTCKSLWTASAGVNVKSSPAVANGEVYVEGADGLYTFDAAGSTGCSGTPKTCAPLWTASLGSSQLSSPAVANGIIYVNSFNGTVYAFNAAGSTGCSGTPKTCAPLWTAPTGNLLMSSPAVANGVVYVGSGTFGTLYAFSAAGSTGCSGSPKTCAALWTASLGSECECLSSPAVANGVVYVGTDFLTAVAPYAILAFSTTGSGPLWTALPGSLVQSSPSIANGTLYIADHLHLFAFKP
jgi:outer membrane protein assembly factor BamB